MGSQEQKGKGKGTKGPNVNVLIGQMQFVQKVNHWNLLNQWKPSSRPIEPNQFSRWDQTKW